MFFCFMKFEPFLLQWGSPGDHNRVPPGGIPGSNKRTSSAKVAISLQRSANFQILDFGTPLEKSVSLTFSEQWLCHFSKKFRCCLSGRRVRQQGHHTPTSCTEARWRILYIILYLYIYIYSYIILYMCGM